MEQAFLNEKVLIALVGLVGAIIGSVLTTFFAPWVKWKLEEKRERLKKEFEDKERKREQIKKWRDMLLQVHKEHEAYGKSIQETLQTHREFLDLQPHLSTKGKSTAYKENRNLVVG